MKRRNIIYICSVVIVTVIMLCIVFSNKKTKYDVVVLGDSNIGNFRDETSVTAIIERETGLKVYNAGFGGSTAVNVNEASLVNLTDAIINQEFSKVLAKGASRYDGDLTYYDKALRDLANVDFDSVKVIVIAYGTNDQLMGADINEYDRAINDSIKRLQERYPNIKIIAVRPFYNEGRALDRGQADIEEYGKRIRCEYIYDGYNSGIITKENIGEMTLDGLHLNETARELYGIDLSGLIVNIID